MSIVIIKLKESCWGKNTIKGATGMSGHSIKLHFCMFERSQVKHNSLDVIMFFRIFSINYKIYMFQA
jgi:hypothetical protein